MNCSIGWVRFSENCSISVKWVSHSGWIARSKAAATSKLSKFWFKFTHFPPCSVHSAASWWISQDGGTTGRWCVTDVCVGRSASIKPEQLVSQRQAAWHCSRPRVRKETNNQMTKFDEFDEDFKKLHEVTWSYMKLMTFVNKFCSNGIKWMVSFESVNESIHSITLFFLRFSNLKVPSWTAHSLESPIPCWASTDWAHSGSRYWQ